MELHCERCNICGEKHRTESCSDLENVRIIKDTVTASRARLSLPKGLEVVDYLDGTTNVIARDKFRRGVQFGPLIARLSSTIGLLDEFPMKIFDEDEAQWQYLDKTDEDLCNWMCLVSAANCKEEQNVICFQMKRKVYFLVTKDLESGDQLKVWYAPYYATQMSAMDLPSLSICDNQYFSDSEEEVVVLNSKSICNEPTKLKKSKKMGRNLSIKFDRLISVPMPNYSSLSEMKDQLIINFSSKMLGAKESKKEWICVICDTKNTSLPEHAKHLMNHYKSTLHKCSYCGSIFKKAKILEEHYQVFHKNIHLKASEDPKHVDTRISNVDNITNETSKQTEVDLPNITSKESKQTSIINISNVFDDPLLKKSSCVDASRSPLCSSKETSIQKEYDMFLDSFNDFSSKSIDENGDMRMKSPGRNLNLDTFSLVDSLHKNNASSESDRLYTSTNSMRNKELESLNPPILGLGDEIVFQNIKSFTGAESPDKNATVSDKMSFENHLISECHMPNIEIQGTKSTSIIPSTDKSFDAANDYMVLLYGQALEVTDEDKNRLVDNLIKDTEDRLNLNVCDINCDAELMKDMLNDGSFSTSDIAKNSVDDPVTEISLSLNDRVSAVTGQTDMVDEKLPNGVGVLENDSLTKIDLVLDEATSQTSNMVFIDDNKPFDLIEKSELGDSGSEMNLKFNDNISASLNKIPSQRNSINSGENQQNNLLPAVNIGLNYNQSVTQVTSEETQRNLKEKKSFCCEICKKRFCEARYLYRHLKKHTGEFTCVQCLRVFARKETLQKHTCSQKIDCYKDKLKSKANDENVIDESCGFILGLPSEMTSIWNCSTQGSLKKIKRKCMCEVCGRTFNTTKGLLYHQKTHREKLFTCDICDKKFHRKNVLMCHLATHAGNKELCPICKKMFSSRKSLRVHIKQHTGEKPFKCDICSKSYAQKVNLQKHLKKHPTKNSSKRYQEHDKKLPSNDVISAEATEIRSGNSQSGLQLPRKANSFQKPKTFRKKEVYICSYCNQRLHSKHSLQRHLKMKHKDRKEDWMMSETLESMRLDSEDTKAEDCIESNNSDCELITVNAVEDIEMTNNSNAITIQASIADERKLLQTPIMNPLCQLNYDFTLKSKNVDETNDGIENQQLIQSISVADFMLLDGNEKTPAFILEDGTVVQSDVQLDTDLFYLVVASSDPTNNSQMA